MFNNNSKNFKFLEMEKYLIRLIKNINCTVVISLIIQNKNNINSVFERLIKNNKYVLLVKY